LIDNCDGDSTFFLCCHTNAPVARFR
jgi:hypothetical protein